MPLKHFKYTNAKDDGRHKIDTETKKEIIATYRKLKSYQKTADHFSISKMSVYFVLNPDKLKSFQKKRNEAKPWKKYYSKENSTKKIQKYRAKKRLLGFLLRADGRRAK